MGFSVENYVVGPVATNCYFLINDDTHEAIVIDPGSAAEALYKKLSEGGNKPVAILLTHGHFDHADAVEDFVALCDDPIPVYAHEAEKKTLEDPSINLSSGMGFNPKKYHATDYVKDGEIIRAAGFEIEVLFTPGHTPGGCCFYLKNEDICFTGDTLFCGSVGRTDFPGGSMSTLVASIREKLISLPEKTICYPGHDSVTSIADEKSYNPFL